MIPVRAPGIPFPAKARHWNWTLSVLKNTKDLDMAPPHPGEILREDILPRLAMSRSALARHLAIPRKLLADLIAERIPVTFDLAQRLGAALGSGARYWLGLQAQYDLWLSAHAEPVRIRPVVWRQDR